MVSSLLQIDRWGTYRPRSAPPARFASTLEIPLCVSVEHETVIAAPGHPPRAVGADLVDPGEVHYPFTMHPELDLARSIRPGLDILANEIVIALKKRTRYPWNPEIYRAGLVVKEPGLSLLDYVLGQVERAHAELGRYTYASQEAYTDVARVLPVIDRREPDNPIRPMASGVGTRIVAYYLEWVGASCREGSDPDTYGETVTADVAALLTIMERINVGKLVAESKYAEDTAAFRATGGRREDIVDLIVRKDREAEVHALARRLAEHYEFDVTQATDLFAWMIETTIDVEVQYIRMRLAGDE